MPTNSSKRKRWLRDLGDHYRKVQRARLNDALLSDYSSISKHSSSESDGRQANADAPLDLGADLEQLNQDLDMLHVGLTIGFIFYFNLSRSLCSSAPFSLGRSR